MLGRGGVAATACDGCRRVAAAASMTAAQAAPAMADPADELEVWSFFMSYLFNSVRIIGSDSDQTEHFRCYTDPRGYEIRFIEETCSLLEKSFVEDQPLRRGVAPGQGGARMIYSGVPASERPGERGGDIPGQSIRPGAGRRRIERQN